MDPRADRVHAELRATRLRVALRLAHLVEQQGQGRRPLRSGPALLAAAVLLVVALLYALWEGRADSRPPS
ncbi:MAG: hypothetical protein ACK45F_01200 [bacterium]